MNAGSLIRNRHDDQRVEGEDGGIHPRNVPTLSEQDNDPVQDVVQHHTAPTGPEPERRRMKWTNEINTQVMRSYFTVTALETDMTMYRDRMHDDFIGAMPHFSHLSTQRIADQRRAIIRRNLLPAATIDQIRESVRQLEQAANPQPAGQDEQLAEQRPQQPPREPAEGIEIRYEQPTAPLNTENPSSLETKWKNEFHANLVKYTGTDPSLRPNIPKIRYSSSYNKILSTANSQLKQIMPQVNDLQELHLHIYCAALASVTANNQNQVKPRNAATPRTTQPAWERRIIQNIENLRKNIGRVQQMANGEIGKSTKRKQPAELTKRLDGKTIQESQAIITDYLDTLKQKLAALSKRLRRYRESYQRKVQNNQFTKNERQFYRSLDEKLEVKEAPGIEEVTNFWKGIWSNKINHNENAPWIRTQEQRARKNPMNPATLTSDDVRRVISTLANWKAPGRDGIQNFWYKRFTSVHECMASQFNKIIREPEQLPSFLVTGVTYLLPKSDNTKDPSQYRPITCLPTMYKILSAAICRIVDEYLEREAILTEEQKGCRRRTLGCKEQITIDAVILEQARQKQRNVCMAYIDYQKAFDSIPHSWLLKALEIYNVDPTIINFLRHTMTKWNTSLRIRTQETNIETESINIERGIFQGDSLSALWFCLALNPISETLNQTGYGFALKQGRSSKVISHLLFMDDLKIYTANKKQFDSVLKLTHQMSSDIGMSFGVKKCQTVIVEKGRLIQGPDIQLDTSTVVTSMNQDPYKYLGILQTNKIEHTRIKQSLTGQFQSRLRKLLKSKLSSKNLTKAINSYAIPILQYSFGVVKWTQTDLENINRMVRTELTKFRKHHPGSAVERINLPREDGGRGIIDAIAACKEQIRSLRVYFRGKDNDIHRAVVRADNNYTPLNLNNENHNQLTERPRDQLLREWGAKALHGRFYNELRRDSVDQRASVQWLVDGNLFPETEGFMIGIQDQVIATLNYKKHIIKENIQNDKCRKCKAEPETIDHILSACQILAGTKYIERHDRVATIVYLELLKMYSFEIDTNTKYYQYKPEPVIENTRVKIYWNKQIITDKTISHNKPDITIINKQHNIASLIDIAIPNNHNIDRKHREKMEKYAELKREIKDMWKLEEVKIVPIILTSMGLVPISLKNSLDDIGVEYKTFRLMQKSVILDAANIVRSVLES